MGGIWALITSTMNDPVISQVRENYLVNYTNRSSPCERWDGKSLSEALKIKRLAFWWLKTVYLTYLLSLEFPGMVTVAVCCVRSSGLVKLSWYRYHFWPNSRLITCLRKNIFHDTAGSDYTECPKVKVRRGIIPCKHRGSGLRCSVLDRQLEPGESEQDPNKGKK